MIECADSFELMQLVCEAHQLWGARISITCSEEIGWKDFWDDAVKQCKYLAELPGISLVSSTEHYVFGDQREILDIHKGTKSKPTSPVTVECMLVNDEGDHVLDEDVPEYLGKLLESL